MTIQDVGIVALVIFALLRLVIEIVKLGVGK